MFFTYYKDSKLILAKTLVNYKMNTFIFFIYPIIQCKRKQKIALVQF